MTTKMLSLAALLALFLPYAACTLDNPEAPDLAGPSELGMSIEMRAIPDSLVSDGFSSSIIEAVVRGPSGERETGRTINFDITRSGAGFLDLGNLAPVNGARPAAGGVESGPTSAVSDGGGVARVRYWAPFRTDQENDTIVSVTGRQASTNFSNQVHRTVEIFLRAADRPSFPGANKCSIIVEPDSTFYTTGQSIAFTAAQIVGDETTCAGNEIARYEWTVNDTEAVTKTGRSIVHSFDAAGTYPIFLVTHEAVTGCRATCSVTLDISP